MAATGFKMALGEDEAPWFWCWLVLGMGEGCDWGLRRCCASRVVRGRMLILRWRSVFISWV